MIDTVLLLFETHWREEKVLGVRQDCIKPPFLKECAGLVLSVFE
jgi:hypothetical protein